MQRKCEWCHKLFTPTYDEKRCPTCSNPATRKPYEPIPMRQEHKDYDFKFSPKMEKMIAKEEEELLNKGAFVLLKGEKLVECKYCSKQFITTDGRLRYCSNACATAWATESSAIYKKSWREKHKEEVNKRRNLANKKRRCAK